MYANFIVKTRFMSARERKQIDSAPWETESSDCAILPLVSGTWNQTLTLPFVSSEANEKVINIFVYILIKLYLCFSADANTNNKSGI